MPGETSRARARKRATPACVRIPCRCPDHATCPSKGTDMDLLLAGIAAAALSVYLFWTLLRPEDF
ncbi:MAG: potassium-transporting ATPase subunit F [Fibrobacteres bacterium]|nr:potassium-transporting ATPase subunit F [Fibrobacterota bacterium]